MVSGVLDFTDLVRISQLQAAALGGMCMRLCSRQVAYLLPQD